MPVDVIAWPDPPDGSFRCSPTENLNASLTVVRNAKDPKEAAEFCDMLGLSVFEARKLLNERDDDV